MKKTTITLIQLTFFLNLLFANSRAPGALLSYELLDSKTYQETYDEIGSYLSPPPLVICGSSIYSITYETVDPFGNYHVASGSVTIPDINEYRPMLTWGHGTQLERDNVTSNDGYDIITTWMGGAGFITIAPDYLGLGVSNIMHPYQQYGPSATAVIDMMKATEELIDELNTQWNGQHFMIGYSEGGYTVMAAQKMIEENYSHEFDLTMTAPCAGAYSMSGEMYNLMMSEQPYANPFYLPYYLFGIDYVYSDVLDDIENYLLPEFAESLPPLFDGYYSADDINSIMPLIPISIVKPDSIEAIKSNENHIFRQILREQDIFDWTPKTPMKLYHSVQDEQVPISNSILAYNTFIENGAEQIEYIPCDCGLHSPAALYIILGAATRFVNEEVLAQKPIKISIENLNITSSNTNGNAPNGTFDIVVESDYDIGGFQFEVYGATIDSFSGGAAEQNGFSTSASLTTVIGFSLTGGVIPQGEYTLLSDISFFDSQSLGKICLSDGVIADVQAQQIPIVYGDCQSLFVQMPGDINHDGLVDVLDVILTVSQIIDESTIDQEDFWIIDLNDDMEINISDVIMLINIILSN